MKLFRVSLLRLEDRNMWRQWQWDGRTQRFETAASFRQATLQQPTQLQSVCFMGQVFLPATSFLYSLFLVSSSFCCFLIQKQKACMCDMHGASLHAFAHEGQHLITGAA